MRPGLPFEPILESATRERDGCARKVTEAQALTDTARQRQALLENHFAATTATLAAKPGARADGNTLRDARIFLHRLELAIRRQGEEVRACEARLDEARVAMLVAEKRLRAFDELRLRSERSQARIERQRDQALMDEFAARTMPRVQPT